MIAPPTLRTNPLSHKKLLLTKWTASTPMNQEKHFIVVKVIEPALPDRPPEFVELEAVHSKRVTTLPWRELGDASRWRRGWC